MAHPDEAFVRATLEKRARGATLRSAIQGGWNSLIEKHPERVWWRRKATRAGLVWEYSVQNVITALDADEGVRVIPHNDTVSFILDDQVLVRFKKADLQLRSRNYPTPLALSFHDHNTDLFHFQGYQRVEAAYVLNRFETEIDWIGIVAREKRRLLWDFELDQPSASVERLPLPEKVEPAAARVIRPKHAGKDKKQEDERS